ncbi:early activation antigen CD69-like isoform X2 [Pseudophryne corroboree]
MEPEKKFKRYHSGPSKNIFWKLCLLTILIVLLIPINFVLWRIGKHQCSSTLNSTSSVTPENSIERSAPCEDNWIWYRGKCYYINDTADTWTNSQSSCVSHNASLAIINDEAELGFLNRFQGKLDYWIGLCWNSANITWTWTDGTTYNKTLFIISSVSENSHKSECAYLNHYNVKSRNGAYVTNFICARRSYGKT